MGHRSTRTEKNLSKVEYNNFHFFRGDGRDGGREAREATTSNLISHFIIISSPFLSRMKTASSSE